MAGYLDEYGAGDERREKTVKIIVVAVILLALISGILAFVLHNYKQQRQVKRFFQYLEAKDYKAAYGLWGCTDAKPCHDYPIESFMRDWSADAAPVTDVDVLNGESCGTGVVVDVDAGKAGEKRLWVDRDTLGIGFMPPTFTECPHRNRISDFLRDLKYRLHGRTYRSVL